MLPSLGPGGREFKVTLSHTECEASPGYKDPVAPPTISQKTHLKDWCPQW